MKHSLRVGCLSLLLIAMSCKSSSAPKDTSWFSAGKPTPPITHVVLVWLKTRDPELGRPLTAWLDTWVEATARAENGKPAGVLPAAIRWPTAPSRR